MKNVISGMAYFFATALAVLIILVIIATLNMQRLGFTENGNEEKDPSTMPEEASEGNLTSDDDSDTTQPKDNPDIPTAYANGDDEIPVGPPIFNTNAVYYNGDLELPVNGATGYTSVDMDMVLEDLVSVTTLKAGTAFLILEEDGEWWKVSVNKKKGWVKHLLCMINLPDVIPSIVYNNTNAYMSVVRAGGKDIPNITGHTLYSYSSAVDRHYGKAYNERLQDYEYIIPVLYSMAKRIRTAQQYALSNGDTLIIYEGFRPWDVQQLISRELKRLADSDSEVRKGLTTSPWSMGWFVASGTSNHQLGYAIDTSLGKVIIEDERSSGDYKYKKVQAYEYDMPTDIQDGSIASAVYTSPTSYVLTAAMKANEPARNLQKYCMDAGLSPLPSEWWHFNDNYSARYIPGRSNGKYEITDLYSAAPTINEELTVVGE